MRKTLVLPIAGESNRYPTKEPKWFLLHPSGKRMITESIRDLPISDFDEILIIGMEKHDNLISACALELANEYNIPIRYTLLWTQTKSQPETVYEGIKQNYIKGAILIKDCDGSFSYKPNWEHNHVAVGDLHTVGKINAANKSYVKIDDNNTVGNIVEKKIISNLFNVGGYYFTSASEFCEYYESIKHAENLYISHIIYKMLIDKHIFFIESVDNYRDWGTYTDWIDYKKTLSTDKGIVIDLDGTLIKTDNTPYEDRVAIQDVVKKLQEYKRKGFYITIETSRNMNYLQQNQGLITTITLPIIVESLKKHNIPYDEIRLGKAWEGKHGFRVDNKTIRPDEFVSKSYEEIMELIT